MAHPTDDLQSLISQLQEVEAKIRNGNGTVEDAQELQEIAQWVFEKTTWLKYKAMENGNAAPVQKEVVKEEPIVKETVAPEKKEELAQEKPVQEEKTAEERPAFDFTSAFSTDEKISSEEENKVNEFKEKTEEEPSEEPEEEPTQPETQTSLLDAIGTEDPSINEALMEEEDNSLASKMQKSPIDNLNDAIGMNDRFSYINELFEEKSDEYNKAVTVLNGLNNKVEAKEKLSEMAVEYSWDLENKVVQMFVELVERRYS